MAALRTGVGGDGRRRPVSGMAPYLPEIAGQLRAFRELDVNDKTATRLCHAGHE